MEYVETSGYIPDAILGGPSLNSALRGAITPLGINVTEQGQVGDLYKHVSMTGGFVNGGIFIVGDFKRGLVYSFRQEMTIELAKEATLKSPDGTEYNLFQQNMVAFRFEMRFAAAIVNPVNRINDTGRRYPFAIIKNAKYDGSGSL